MGQQQQQLNGMQQMMANVNVGILGLPPAPQLA